MKNLQTSGASVRNSFINEFAFGDKSEAIRGLIHEAHSSNRQGDLTVDGHSPEEIASGMQRLARALRMSA